ncbi:MAG: response regulator [Endomicrobiia bacterium]
MKEKILVVDDEIELLGYLTEVIENYGFNVVSLNSSKKALKLIEKTFFHVAFIDINMPEISGIELAKKIKEIHPLTFIVMITAAAKDKEVDEVLNLGVFSILYKPLKAQKVMEVLHNILTKKLFKSLEIYSVLLVEDDRNLAETLSELLKTNNYDVVVTYNGEQAIEECKKKFFSAVIIDYKLPDISGIELLREVKKFNTNIVSIIITGYEDLNIAISALRENVSDFLIKPFELTDLINSLKKALLNKRL